jgi:hypothetical protein
MYDKATGALSGATTGALAFTGVNVLYALLAGFALLAAGTAILRVVPKKQG